MIWTLSLAVKSTLVLGAATAVAWGLRRSSASARHALWCLALVSLAALPVLSAALPPLGLALLPASLPDAVRHAATVAGGIEGTRAPLPIDPTLFAGMSWRNWALLAWLAGAGIALTQLASGSLVVALAIRRARPVATPEWNALLHEGMTTLGIRGRVELRMSRALDVPYVWGNRSAVVLLPETAASWSEGQRRAVLLHELAHVVRHDCFTKSLAYVVRAVYWPHPLAWWAVSSLRREAERACDDRVLLAGTAATEYARHLLEAARGLVRPPSRLLMASAGAEGSRLGDRVLAVMDEHQDRHVPTRRATALVGGGTLLAIAVLAATVPVAARTHPGSPPVQASTENELSEWIVHEPFGCLVEGRYAELDATIEPASQVAEARLYFKSALSDEQVEYWVEMTRNGSRFVGRLPKPRTEASPVRYRVEARGRDGRVTSTEHYSAVVAADEARCPEDVRIAPRAPSAEPVTVHTSPPR